MHIIKESFNKLYPDKEIPYSVSIKYSGKFKPYNSNVRLAYNHLEFKLSRTWKSINREIRIGLIQSLLLKIFKQSKSKDLRGFKNQRFSNNKQQTTNIDLYNSFIRNLHIAIPKTKTNPILESSFHRINQEYFHDIIEKPNLKWGSESISKLGSYEYQTDTITVSSIFKDTSEELLDYIMYHELLHKKHKFYTKNSRNYHHTSEFKRAEKSFANIKAVEAELKYICSKKRIKRSFFSQLFR